MQSQHSGVSIDNESSYLTKFGTIFGKYSNLVMPYGSIDSQDAFQAKMDQILEGLKGYYQLQMA